jgi:hypothetical protein
MAVSLIEAVVFIGLFDFADNLNQGSLRCQKVSKHSSLEAPASRRRVCWNATSRRDASAPRKWKIVEQRLASGQPAWRNPAEKNGRLVWYSSAVGSDLRLADVILERVKKSGEDGGLRMEDGALSGHPLSSILNPRWLRWIAK